MRFHIVDVFAEEKYAGNQLAVFRNVKDLSPEVMQKIAREMNYSETTFILSEVERDGGYDVRIFTPKEEVPFAGHPTLGTAYIIMKEIERNKRNFIALNLKAGKIPVRNEQEVLWMQQKEPRFGSTLKPEQVAPIIGLNEESINSEFSIQEVSTGLSHLIVPLKTLDAIKRCRVDKSKYFKLVQEINSKGILVFAPETYKKENNLNVRVFADYYSVPEDPATGSGNGCLAGYLAKYRYFGESHFDQIRVEQGYEIGRPSLLLLKASAETQINVQVGGKVIPVASGEFL